MFLRVLVHIILRTALLLRGAGTLARLENTGERPRLPLMGDCLCGCRCRDVALLVKRGTGTLLTQVQFPGVTRDFFSPRVNFQYRLS